MPRIVVPALLVALLTLGAACGGSDDPGADPTADPTASSSSTPSTPASSPTETATASVEPATGPVLDMPLSSVHIPDDWKVMEQLVSTQQDASDDDSASSVSLGEMQSFGGASTPEELAQNTLQTNPFAMDPKELPVVEIDGVEFYHLAGKVQKFDYLEDFGAVVDDMIVNLTFHFSPEISAEERAEIVDSVLASFEFK